MGLDMYLTKKIYIGADYKHRNVTGEISIKIGDKPVKIDFEKVSSIEEKAGYWRKANQIHKWFVDNVQDGKDDCEEYDVSFEKLVELRDLCETAIKTKNPEILPPQDGFFFGGTAIDEWYWGGIADTIEILKSLDPDGDYSYHSSW